jgi:hypothetical protein
MPRKVDIRLVIFRKVENTQMVIFTAAAETRLSKELHTSGSMFPRVVHIFDAQRLTEGIVSLSDTNKEWIFEL